MKLLIALLSSLLFMGACGNKEKIAKLEDELSAASETNAELEKKLGSSRYSTKQIGLTVVTCMTGFKEEVRERRVKRDEVLNLCSCMAGQLYKTPPLPESTENVSFSNEKISQALSECQNPKETENK